MNNYDKQIKSIKRKRLLIIIASLIVLLLAGFFIDSFAVILVLLPLCFFEVIAIAIVISPLNTSLDSECDPEKYLALNEAIGNGTQKTVARACGYFYVGRFEEAVTASEAMISSKKLDMKLAGYFNKARAEFMLGSADEVRQAVKGYGETVSSEKKLSQRQKDVYTKMGAVLNLIMALSESDREGIKRYCDEAVAWNAGKMSEGFVNYMRGVASHRLGDTEDCIYRFMTVKERYPRTVLARYAEDYLREIKRAENNDGEI